MIRTDTPTTLARGIILLIAVVQVILGVILIVAPHAFASVLGLAAAPEWTDWMFAQFGARSLGFAYGMWLVLKDARRHASWISAMIGVQVVDWLGTVLALVAGKVTIAQVATAPILPVLFVVVLTLEIRRQARTTPAVATNAGM